MDIVPISPEDFKNNKKGSVKSNDEHKLFELFDDLNHVNKSKGLTYESIEELNKFKRIMHRYNNWVLKDSGFKIDYTIFLEEETIGFKRIPNPIRKKLPTLEALINEALDRYNGDEAKAAEAIGITQEELFEKLDMYTDTEPEDEIEDPEPEQGVIASIFEYWDKENLKGAENTADIEPITSYEVNSMTEAFPRFKDLIKSDISILIRVNQDETSAKAVGDWAYQFNYQKLKDSDHKLSTSKTKHDNVWVFKRSEKP